MYIVISYREDDSDVPLKVKIRWVHQLTKHLNNVHILSLKDKFKTKEEYTQEYWDADCKKLLYKKSVANWW